MFNKFQSAGREVALRIIIKSPIKVMCAVENYNFMNFGLRENSIINDCVIFDVLVARG